MALNSKYNRILTTKPWIWLGRVENIVQEYAHIASYILYIDGDLSL